VARKALDALNRAIFRPDTSSPTLNSLVALTPAVLVGLSFFGLPAIEMLVVALAIGGGVHAAAHHAKQRLQISPVVPALVGVALVGPGASLVWTAAIALLASVLEVVRARFLPRARLDLGILAYAAIFLASRGAPAAYLTPHTLAATPEPIRLWLQLSAASQSPIDPVRLYVGNVPGPVFATSVLAVVLGATWLWYARRLSLLVVLMVGLGALACIRLMGWSAVYHLDSGPLWFTAALILADRRTLPPPGLARPLLGLAAGVVTVAARVRGAGIEAVPITVAALQLVVALVEAAGWLIPNRRRVRDAARQAGAPGLVTRLGHKVRAS
jgi:NQR2/RnfD/RnfE family subunit of NADH-ubiquinone oxidoreductase